MALRQVAFRFGATAYRRLLSLVAALDYPELMREERSMTRSTGTLTRADIAAAIRDELGVPNAKSFEMVEAILGLMCSALSRGENVKISGFGTFLQRDKPERVGRNPKTGEEHAIAPRRVLTFRASAHLRNRVAGTGSKARRSGAAQELVTQD
jgi:integration host factor subunit alpha